MTTTDSSTQFVREFVAGNCGGIVGICTVYPLDTIKIRMQTNGSYSSTYDVFNKMVRSDGIKSLYRGLASPASGFGLTFAISFSSYGYCCRHLQENNRQNNIESLSWKDQVLAGAITGIVQSPARQIVERIKSVMQVKEISNGKAAYTWSGSCFVELVRQNGIRKGLFQGMSSVFLREIPQFAVYYPTYEITKNIYSQYTDNIMLSQFLAGGTAGVAQWLPPIFCTDVIKSRMQTAPSGYYSGILDCASRLYREEGASIFFRGFGPAMLRAFPLHAIIFVVYELTLKQYDRVTTRIEHHC